jgi:hypothetical protein
MFIWTFFSHNDGHYHFAKHWLFLLNYSVYNPNHPIYIYIYPKSLVYTPNHPIYTRNHSAYTSNHPIYIYIYIYTQNHSVYTPNRPTYTRNHSVYTPNHPIYTRNHSLYTPNHPVYTRNHSAYTPNHHIYIYSKSLCIYSESPCMYSKSPCIYSEPDTGKSGTSARHARSIDFPSPTHNELHTAGRLLEKLTGPQLFMNFSKFMQPVSSLLR